MKNKYRIKPKVPCLLIPFESVLEEDMFKVLTVTDHIVSENIASAIEKQNNHIKLKKKNARLGNLEMTCESPIPNWLKNAPVRKTTVFPAPALNPRKYFTITSKQNVLPKICKMSTNKYHHEGAPQFSTRINISFIN